MQYHSALATLTMSLLAPSGAAQHLVYDAGEAGNPPQAPSPTTAGWSQYLTAPSTAFDISPDTDWGINAWQLHDPGAGSVGYRLLFPPDDGFVFRMEMRPLAASTWFYYDSGDLILHNIFEVEFEIQGADVVVDSHPVAGGGVPLVCPGATDGAYHTFALVVRGATDLFLDLYYDGTFVGELEWSDFGLFHSGTEVSWGTRDPAGRARYHAVELRALDHVGLLGANYCGPAVPSSSGIPATIEALGTIDLTAQALTLSAVDLPQDQFGYFLASRTPALVMGPGGSQGNLCLGGSIGRYASSVQSSGPGGTFSIPVDLTSIPTTPPQSVHAGETWNYQAWFRDVNPTSTSNFTDAVAVTLY